MKLQTCCPPFGELITPKWYTAAVASHRAAPRRGILPVGLNLAGNNSLRLDVSGRRVQRSLCGAESREPNVNNGSGAGCRLFDRVALNLSFDTDVGTTDGRNTASGQPAIGYGRQSSCQLKIKADVSTALVQGAQHIATAWVSITRRVVIAVRARQELRVDRNLLAYANNLPCRKEMNIAVFNASQGRAG